MPVAAAIVASDIVPKSLLRHDYVRKRLEVYRGNLSIRKWPKAHACLFFLKFKKMRPDVPCAFLKFKKMGLDVPFAFLTPGICQ